MEKASKRLAENIGTALNYDDEKKAVLAYGFIGISQFLIILSLTAISGFVFGYIIESLIIFFAVGLLRRAIGGVHSGGYYSCIIITVFSVNLMAALGKYLFAPSAPIGFVPLSAGIAVVYLTAFLLTYKLVPVGTPNKPIRSEAKRKRLKKNAYFTLAIFIFISAILLAFVFYGDYIYLRSCVSVLALSVLSQVCLITKPGHAVINFVDRIFGAIKRICFGK